MVKKKQNWIVIHSDTTQHEVTRYLKFPNKWVASIVDKQ